MRTHFVTGASGFLGRHLVRALLDGGDRVIVLLRPNEDGSASDRARMLFPDAKELICYEGDITSENLGLSREVQHAIAVFRPEFWHLAADLSFDVKNRERIFRTNVTGTENAIAFANVHAQRFWYMSTAYVQGEPHGIIREGDLAPNPRFRNQYEATKYQAEKLVRETIEIPFLVIRPSVILGDAYREKALGCAFGYYRYLHILHRFRAWVRRLVSSGGMKGFLLHVLGTQVREDRGSREQTVCVPWLFLPEPRKGKVNVVPVLYVIDVLLVLLPRTHDSGTTVHVVHQDPPTYTFLVSVLLDDLSIRGVHTFSVPIFVFSLGLKLIRLIFPAFSVYAGSALWYVPYISDIYEFETTASCSLGIPPPPVITREYMSRVNIGAITAIEQDVP